MSLPIELIPLTLSKATPLLLAAFGGLLTELAGLINFALEGMMLSGAFAAVFGTWLTGSPWIGLLCGMATGALAGVLHAIVSLKLRANMIVSSIGINLLAAGLTGLLLNQVFDVYGTSPGVAPLPELGVLIPHDPASMLYSVFEDISALVPLAILAVSALFAFLNRTVYGLRLKACGENPEAALAAGISVWWTRFSAACMGGALAGMGGAFLSIGELSQFMENMTQGRGYLAIAAVILGRWKPAGVLAAVLLFGFGEALSEWLAVRWSSAPHQVFFALPYLACLAVLTFYTGTRQPPSALGRA